MQDEGGFSLWSGRPGGGFSLDVSTTGSACRRLQKLIGGGCGDSKGRTLPAPESFHLRTLGGNTPLQVEVQGKQLRTLQMTQGTRKTEQKVPTEWALREDAQRTVLSFRCDERTPVAFFISPAKHEEVAFPCTPFGETYRLHVSHAGSYPAIMFASAVSLFTVEEAVARAALLAVQDWKVAIDGSEGSLSPDPVEIEVQSEKADLSYELRSSVDPPVEEMTADTERAGSLTVSGDQRLRSWVARHLTIAIFLFSVVIVPLLSWLWGVVWREDA